MTEHRLPQFLQSVVCDEVRKEVTGKEILIGVYGDDIIVGAFPATLLLSLWVRARFDLAGDWAALFQVVGKSGRQLLTPQVAILRSPGVNHLVSITFGGIPLQLEGPEQIKFQWHFGGGDWHTIGEIEIKASNLTTMPGFVQSMQTTAAKPHS